MPTYGGTGTPASAAEPESGYCTVEQLQDLMSLTFTSTSKPTDAKAAEIIEEVSGELDGVIAAAGYELPITNAGALLLLRRYNTFGAAASCWHAGYVTDNDLPRVTYWATEYNNFIRRLKNGEQALPGETPESGVNDPAFAIAAFKNTAELD